MKIKVKGGPEGACVEVIDPSDGAVTHAVNVVDGEQVIVTATTAQSPADISVADVEAIPEAEVQAETGEGATAPEGEQAEAPVGEQPGTEAEGAEQAEDAEPGDAGNGNTISRGGPSEASA